MTQATTTKAGKRRFRKLSGGLSSFIETFPFDILGRPSRSHFNPRHIYNDSGRKFKHFSIFFAPGGQFRNSGRGFTAIETERSTSLKLSPPGNFSEENISTRPAGDYHKTINPCETGNPR